jgi:hypothetical protein
MNNYVIGCFASHIKALNELGDYTAKLLCAALSVVRKVYYVEPD